MSKLDFGGSNLVKGYRLTPEEGTHIVDTNSIIEEKLRRLEQILPVVTKTEFEEFRTDEGEFSDGLDASVLEALTGDYEAETDEDGNPVSNVIKAAPSEEPAVDIEALVAERMAAAEQEIAAMKEAAMNEIDSLKARAIEEGQNMGYEEGLRRAAEENEAARAAIEAERANLSKERAEMIEAIEPQFVNVITDVYERAFNVRLKEEKKLVTELIHNAMLSVESCKNYLIHVSSEDHDYVVEHRDELRTSTMPEDANIDIVEDITMKTGDCMIETPGGIYDCGLGTQLGTLKNKLELLSYTP